MSLHQALKDGFRRFRFSSEGMRTYGLYAWPEAADLASVAREVLAERCPAAGCGDSASATVVHVLDLTDGGLATAPPQTVEELRERL